MTGGGELQDAQQGMQMSQEALFSETEWLMNAPFFPEQLEACARGLPVQGQGGPCLCPPPDPGPTSSEETGAEGAPSKRLMCTGPSSRWERQGHGPKRGGPRGPAGRPRTSLQAAHLTFSLPSATCEAEGSQLAPTCGAE